MFMIKSKKLTCVVAAGAALVLATAGVGAGVMATSQSSTSVSALDQTVNTKLSASEKLPTKLYSSSTKLSVKVSGDKDNYTVTYTKNGKTVLTLKKQTKSSTAAAKSAAKPAVSNPGGTSVSLTSKTKNAAQQGLMGQVVTTWNTGKWQVKVNTVTASQKDPTTVSKTLAKKLVASALPSTSSSSQITLTVGTSSTSSANNQAKWTDGDATYTMTASDYKVLVNALTSFK